MDDSNNAGYPITIIITMREDKDMQGYMLYNSSKCIDIAVCKHFHRGQINLYFINLGITNAAYSSYTSTHQLEHYLQRIA